MDPVRLSGSTICFVAGGFGVGERGQHGEGYDMARAVAHDRRGCPECDDRIG